jgi:predicted RNA-binding protein Jag
MQSIVSKGKDVHEAIHLGLNLLETTKNRVHIEIIQHETKGFLGIGSKMAVVKLTKNNASAIPEKSETKSVDVFELAEQLVTEEINEKPWLEETVSMAVQAQNPKPAIEEDLLGKVWVKDGKLFCKSSPTRVPMITVPSEMKLYKNGQLINDKTTAISENDDYDIVVKNHEAVTQWKIKMDEQKLRVNLHVEPGYKIIRSVLDVEPDYHIDLQMIETKENLNTLSYTEIIQELEQLRVKHGFNQIEMMKATEASEPSTFEIATGVSPKPGKNGWIELTVDLNLHEGPKEREDGRVDFREIKHIPTVERGKVIGIIHPPIPGEIGYTVTNEPLPAPQTFPITINTGKGIQVIEDKIVATESGRPKVEKRGQLVKISIMPKLTHQGDVNIESGNIRFMGDVEVKGEVGENMVVEAEGDITIHKSVNMATITTSGAIVTYGNIVGSEISAGKNNMLVVELGHLLGIMHQQTEKMIEVIKQLTRSPAFKSSDFSRGGLQPLIRILLDKKFQHFPPLAKKYVEIVRRGDSYLEDDAWREVAITLTKLFLSISNEVTSLDRIIVLSEKMKELHTLSQTPVEPDSYITVPNVLNSKIYCSGNVLVMGKGCVNSKIHAGGALKISGIVRGGEVYGRLGVEINEVGAESGTATIISVPHDQMIKINKVMEGTSILIGNVKHTFKETKHHVIAQLDSNNRVIFK